MSLITTLIKSVSNVSPLSRHSLITTFHTRPPTQRTTSHPLMARTRKVRVIERNHLVNAYKHTNQQNEDTETFASTRVTDYLRIFNYWQWILMPWGCSDPSVLHLWIYYAMIQYAKALVSHITLNFVHYISFSPFRVHFPHQFLVYS